MLNRGHKAKRIAGDGHNQTRRESRRRRKRVDGDGDGDGKLHGVMAARTEQEQINHGNQMITRRRDGDSEKRCGNRGDGNVTRKRVGDGGKGQFGRNVGDGYGINEPLQSSSVSIPYRGLRQPYSGWSQTRIERIRALASNATSRPLQT